MPTNPNTFYTSVGIRSVSKGLISKTLSCLISSDYFCPINVNKVVSFANAESFWNGNFFIVNFRAIFGTFLYIYLLGALYLLGSYKNYII